MVSWAQTIATFHGAGWLGFQSAQVLRRTGLGKPANAAWWRASIAA